MMSEKEIQIAGGKFELRLFTEGFRHHDGPNACTSLCCRHGVYLDPTERDRILDSEAVVRKYMDDTQPGDKSKWFDNSEETDPDFPSGVCVSTEVHNDKCVFLDGKGRCVLQVAEKEEGMDRFALKPFYCVLFPIVKIDGVISYDDFCSGESACCTADPESGRKMVESCRLELEHAVGGQKYAQVLEYFRKNFIENKSADGPMEVRKESIETGR